MYITLNCLFKDNNNSLNKLFVYFFKIEYDAGKQKLKYNKFLSTSSNVIRNGCISCFIFFVT